MYSMRLNTRELNQVVKNVVDYTDGFLKESKAKESTIASKLGDISIEAFYDYLDGLARTNPGMLHHIYEWESVGDPQARLVQLKKALSQSRVNIDADFLQSMVAPEGGSEPFYDKATIMEEGITVVVQAVQAKAMFFEYQGEEFFRAGPIVIENPGGEATRGSFLRVFEEFYNNYFDEVYLRSIRFYDHFKKSRAYKDNFGRAAKSTGARSIGRTTALKWIMTIPGDDR